MDVGRDDQIKIEAVRSGVMSLRQKFLFIGPRRGGSSITFGLISRLFLRCNRPILDLVSQAAQTSGLAVDELTRQSVTDALEQHDLVGCFRDIPPTMFDMDLDDVKTIFLSRDPRECALSWYYARQLHPDDPSVVRDDHGLDYYIRHQDNLIDSYSNILRFSEKTETLRIKYEDLYCNPVKIFLEICAFTDTYPGRAAFDALMIEANFVQPYPDRGAHNRLGAPQSLENIIGEDLLAVLNKRYAALVTRLGYAPEGPTGADPNAIELRREIDIMKRYILELATKSHIYGEELERIGRRLAQPSEPQ